jgi:hypothetical protein
MVTFCTFCTQKSGFSLTGCSAPGNLSGLAMTVKINMDDKNRGGFSHAALYTLTLACGIGFQAITHVGGDPHPHHESPVPASWEVIPPFVTEIGSGHQVKQFDDIGTLHDTFQANEITA